MKKPILYVILVLTVIFLILGILFSIKLINKNTERNLENEKPAVKEENDPLIEYGFSKEEAMLVNDKVNKDNINLIIKNKYEKGLVYDLVASKYYIDSNFERYYQYAQANKKLEEKDVIKNINSNLDYEFYNHDIESDTSKGILMLANKFYKLGSDFEGLDLVDVPAKYSEYNTSFKLNKEAYEHFVLMLSDAQAVGLDFRVYSGYRSYDLQTRLYNNYVNRDGKEAADTYSARPGYSEHQTGLAVDLRSRTMNTDYFEKTNEFKWLQNNAHKYGFILRYNLGQEYITGYMYEPWHYRYCGVDCATYIYENKINFEEYYEYYVKNS